MLRQILFLGIAPLGLYAFLDAHPLVAWSSFKSPTLDALSSQGGLVVNSDTLFPSIVDTHIPCQYDSVILIEQPGLRGSDLRALLPSHIAKERDAAPSSINIPYTYPPPPLGFAQDIATRCQYQLVELGVGETPHLPSLDGGRVIHIVLPEIDVEIGSRRESMKRLGALLASQLSVITPDDSFTRLVLIVGTQASNVAKRHLADLQSSAVLPEVFAKTKASPEKPSSELPKGGILKKYQLLTPGLITILLIVFGLLAPMLYFVISALASIKSPILSDSFRPPNVEKKNQ